ncbi:glycosyltransferase [Modestobacter roseus]|uniref:glycosyltransferase n=1 Tax=Modestobacter roseus TaxID=1181884 RepID=UPI001296C4FA|nr:glycosyltransferase [Modestobacter roseus]MQA32806.1 glycosyltransferase [Modestobacter roseus]
MNPTDETRAGGGGPRRLGVVVVNYGSSDLLRRNLAGAAALGDDVRVVVVDNRSTSEERSAVTELAAQRGWELVASPGNPGFGAATNAGIARARELGCVTFCCLNPDAVVSPEVLAELRRASLADPEALVAPRLVDSSGRTVFAGSTVGLRDGRTGSPTGTARSRGPVEEWLTGACLVISAVMVDRTGGYAEDYFLYWEDVDLSHRVQVAGGHLVVRHDLLAVHDEGGTQGERQGRAKSDLYYRYNCRNRLLFAARNLGRGDLVRWVVRTPVTSWEILLRGGRRQLLRSPRPLLAAARGSLSGLVIALLALVRPGGWTDASRSVLVAHPGAELYGSDRVLLESVEALLGAGPVTVALPGEGPLAVELRARGARVRIVAMPVLRKAALRPRGAVRLLGDALRGLLPAARLIRSAGRGGVYVSTVTVPSWVVLARLLRRRVVCHVHEAERAAPLLARRVLAVGPWLADAVVVNSRFSLGVLGEVAPGVEDRSTVVYNGIRGPVAVVPPRDELDGPVRLLFVGRLNPRKGPQVAVAALRELTDRGVDARLALLGSVFPGYEEFEAELHATVAAAGLDDRVDFLGFHADVWPVVAGADVVLIPSVLDEPFGNTAVEAVLGARPVVVSDTSGLREAAAGYGSAQAVDPQRPALWADAVERVVAQWPSFREQALEDAGAARRRHDPAAYQEVVATLVRGATGAGRAAVPPVGSTA